MVEAPIAARHLCRRSQTAPGILHSRSSSADLVLATSVPV